MKFLGIVLTLELLVIQAIALPKRIVVAQDGSGNYTTVQAAFDAVPAHNTKPVEIYVKKGIYQERLFLPEGKSYITLTGEDKDRTILTYNNHTGTISPQGDTINTYTSASFFENADNFKASNLTFQNNAGFSAGQAVAVYAYGDKLVFDNCNFKGFQDVLFCSNPDSHQYYKNCYIEGTTDFIFGPATVLFQNCTLHSKKNSHITAASTPQNHAYGFVFMHCTLTADTGLNSVSLGRPWRPYASVTYIHCNIGPHILPAGWNNWKNAANEKTARFAEYQCTGPGAALQNRVPWVHQLTSDEAKAFTINNILSGPDHWNPLKQ
ncbi:pectin esterase [Mucilaginibacter robiniae]|uniref:Pectinesterase n=1 Tax=Mucilaginibacter robiniae TaxID=2728022 RepID=A0A7L5DWH4_9SPHI|nr:pectinesterase family protein [Mucilaginibacter robiniae]QJD94598.1 pectin esterase [Mucilaginibacter robiniae]